MKENLLLLKDLLEHNKKEIHKYMTSISKNMYIDNLNDIAHKYSNTYHSTIKMKLADVKSNTYIDSRKGMKQKYPEFEIGDTVGGYQNIKIFLQNAMFQVGLKTFLWLKKLETLYRGNILLVILKAKKLLEPFTNNNYKNQIKSLELKK